MDLRRPANQLARHLQVESSPRLARMAEQGSGRGGRARALTCAITQFCPLCLPPFSQCADPGPSQSWVLGPLLAAEADRICSVEWPGPGPHPAGLETAPRTAASTHGNSGSAPGPGV